MVEQKRSFIKIIATEAIDKYAYLSMDEMFFKIAFWMKKQLNAVYGRSFHVRVGAVKEGETWEDRMYKPNKDGNALDLEKVDKDRWYYFTTENIYFMIESC